MQQPSTWAGFRYLNETERKQLVAMYDNYQELERVTMELRGQLLAFRSKARQRQSRHYQASVRLRPAGR